MSFAARPLRTPAGELDADGMALAEPLRATWGAIPEDARLEKLLGDASTRSYYRVSSQLAQPASLVVMRLPSGGPPEELGLSELPFCNVQRYLAGLQLRVPRVHLDASAHGLLLLEDLGDETFEARLRQQPDAWPALYRQAIELLAALHERTAAGGDCVAYARRFDRALLRWELEHFRDWGLYALDRTLSSAQAARLEALFDGLVNELLALPQGFTHRDYQSRNLMWAPSGELVIIDFQDALLGPLGYDLAALLCDSYVSLSEPLQEQLVAQYAAQRRLPVEQVLHATRLVSVQRKLKDAGRFVFIDQVRGRPSFLPWYSPSLRYVARALAHLPRYRELAELLAERIPGYPEQVATPAARTGLRPAGSL